MPDQVIESFSGLVGFYGISWLFNAKSSLYIYIKYIGFGLVAYQPL